MNSFLKFVAISAVLFQSVTGIAQQGFSPSSAPWHVSMVASALQEHIAFMSRGTQLSGTLYYQPGSHRGPAVVVLHGASSPSQSLPLYEHLKEMLPPLGIAVFVFDRRIGDGQDDFRVLAEDGVSAHVALSRNPHVDAARVGYWGISQGGWLALAAGAIDPKAAFVIAVSAPMTTADVQMDFAVANILRIRGYSPEEVADAHHARVSVDNYLRGHLDRASAESALKAAVQKPWFPLVYMGDKLDDPATSGWLKQMQFDPMTELKRDSAPVLLLYGQDDPWVPVQLSMDRFNTIRDQHNNVSAIVVAGADHTMMGGVNPKDQVDSKYFPKEAPNAPAYFSVLTSWLAQRGFARRLQ